MASNEITTSDAISCIAFLVSALSAVYARYSWSESRKSNEISMLERRKEIYDAFFYLKMHMTQKGEFAELAEVTKFFHHQRNAKVYLTANLAGMLEKYYSACFLVADSIRRQHGMSRTNEEKIEKNYKITEELAPLIESEFSEIFTKIRAA